MSLCGEALLTQSLLFSLLHQSRKIDMSGHILFAWACERPLRQLMAVVAGERAVIGGADTGNVTEDTALITTGTLTISDPDAGQSTFKAENGLEGAHRRIDSAGD